MLLDQTTPTERDRIESPGPREFRLPRWPLGDQQSNLPPKKKTKHVVASGKQHIIGVDGVDDVEAYSNYDEIPLFTDFPKKISVMEKNLPKDILPWERKGVKGKVVTAG